MPEGTVRTEAVTLAMIAEAKLMDALVWATGYGHCMECGFDPQDVTAVIAELDTTRAALAECEAKLADTQKAFKAFALTVMSESVTAISDAAVVQQTEFNEGHALAWFRRVMAKLAEAEAQRDDVTALCDAATSKLTAAESRVAALEATQEAIVGSHEDCYVRLQAAERRVAALVEAGERASEALVTAAGCPDDDYWNKGGEGYEANEALLLALSPSQDAKPTTNEGAKS